MAQSVGPSRQSNPKPNRVAPAFTDQNDNRDPNGLNEHIKCEFYDVIAEPKGVHSFDCIWELSEVLFSCCKNCWYKLFTLMCGCCIAAYWALEFVPVIFSHVWCLTPCYQVVNITCGFWCKNFFNLCVRCFVAPCAKSCAPFFRFCGDGLDKRVDTPSIFPNWDRKSVPPKKEKKPDTPPPPAAVARRESHWDDYDKTKIAKSVKRQLMLM